MDIEELIEERERLLGTVDEASRRLAASPEGRIHFGRRRNSLRCYRRLGDSSEYLSVSRDAMLIEDLIRKRRDLTIVRKLPDQIKAIDDFLAVYNPTLLNGIDCRFSEIRRDLKLPDSCKPMPEPQTGKDEPADGTDLARKLISICTAFLQSKDCQP